MELRPTQAEDIPAVDALLSVSYPILLKPDYPASVLVTALPLISRAQPGLVTCGSYFGVWDDALVAAGGWTRAAPGSGAETSDVGHIRHVVTDHKVVRSGYGRVLMAHIFDTAQRQGITGMACQATRTAVPFYQAMGFAVERDIEIALRAGITFPAVQMWRDL